MNNTTVAKKVEERREFFRVDDEVNLIYKKIDEKQVMAADYASDNILGNCALSTALETLAQESAVLLHRLEKSHPDVTGYLKILDNKIGLLAQGIMMQGSQFDKKSNRHANLSATGIAFDCEESFLEGAFLELKLLLVNSMAVILAHGRVVYCKKNPVDSHYPFVIGVDYVAIKDHDRELLIKHVVKRQLQQIRDKKENQP